MVGQVVTFLYPNREGSEVPRTVLVLNTHEGKLHGVDVSLLSMERKAYLLELSGSFITKDTPEQFYERARPALAGNNCYRTFELTRVKWEGE